VVPSPEPFFLQVDASPLGRRFALHHTPQDSTVRGLVVHVHPFAEEMNKSRRMAALQSRALAAEGFAVLQMDLLGCGDSAGDFGDATWARWMDDVAHACRWLRQQHPDHKADEAALPLWLWGHRAGALLAVQAVQQFGMDCNFLLWQPATAGKVVLQQFLRLKAAGDLLGGQAKAAMERTRSELASGRAVEVAGYAVDPALCHGLEQAVLRPPAVPARRIEWLEISAQDDAVLSPAAAGHVEQWMQAGWAVRAHVVKGPAFWHTTEVEEAPALLSATLDAVRGGSGAAPAAPIALASVRP